MFQITAVQWEWAKDLYTREKGEMYHILLFSNVGSDQVKYKEFINPISMWLKGRIQAHPVYISM